MNNDDPATTLSTTKLMEPLLTQLRAERQDRQIAGHLRDGATKAQLTNLLGGNATLGLTLHGEPRCPVCFW